MKICLLCWVCPKIGPLKHLNLNSGFPLKHLNFVFLSYIFHRNWMTEEMMCFKFCILGFFFFRAHKHGASMPVMFGFARISFLTIKVGELRVGYVVLYICFLNAPVGAMPQKNLCLSCPYGGSGSTGKSYQLSCYFVIWCSILVIFKFEIIL